MIMRLGLIAAVFLVVLARDGLVVSANLRNNKNSDATTVVVVSAEKVPSIYDCLQAASGGDECRGAFDGQCVWCAEPIYGLCVTHSVANKIGKLPFFSCDSAAMKNQQDVVDDGVGGELEENTAEAW